MQLERPGRGGGRQGVWRALRPRTRHGPVALVVVRPRGRGVRAQRQGRFAHSPPTANEANGGRHREADADDSNAAVAVAPAGRLCGTRSPARSTRTASVTERYPVVRPPPRLSSRIQKGVTRCSPFGCAPFRCSPGPENGWVRRAPPSIVPYEPPSVSLQRLVCLSTAFDVPSAAAANRSGVRTAVPTAAGLWTMRSARLLCG